MTFTSTDPANLESILTSFGEAPFNLEVKTTVDQVYDLPILPPLTDYVMNICQTSDSTGSMTVVGITIPVGGMVSFVFSPETQSWYSLAQGGGSTVSPGGANTQVQYNNNGVFGGISGITTDGVEQINLSSTEPEINIRSDANGFIQFQAIDSTNYGAIFNSSSLTDGTSGIRIQDQANNNFDFANGAITFPGKDPDPTPVTEGELYYNNTSHVFRYWNGTAWMTITAS